MEKSKRSPFIRIAGIMLGVCLLTTCFIGSTMAKYTSSAVATGSATVAKWEIDINGTDITASDTVTFDLFTTTYEEDGTTVDEDVVAGKIAPGTGGSFELKVENKSEVTVVYSMTVAVANDSNIPIQYSTDNGTTWTDTITFDAATDKNLAIGANDTQTVLWKWVFAGNDATDTALGIAETAPSVVVTATITATQVD